MKPTPCSKKCMLCRDRFLAEWAWTPFTKNWHISEICPNCEERLRAKAA